MAKLKITDFFIYRWRYFAGYGLFAIGLIVVLLFVGIYLPGGISSQEIQSVLISNSTNLSDVWSADIINLPYNLLQHTSLLIFGVSSISIKLPSLILAFLSAVGMVLLLRQWFKPSIGVLASLIAITTGQFLFIAQNGTPDILYLFWPVWIIFIASLIPLQKKFKLLYLLMFFAMSALSLYTPLSIYVILVITCSVVIHPHLRYLIRQFSRLEIIIGSIIVLTLDAPLIFAITKTPAIFLTLLGFPSTWPNLVENLTALGTQYFNFMNPGGTTIVTPFFELGSMLIIALGAYYVIKTRSTSKNYIIILWTLCLIPIIIINPSITSITFLPLLLLLASGLSGLLAHWYELFPRNPYARAGGLIPLVILITILVLSGVNRYVYEYRYNPDIVNSFSKDLQLIPANTKNIVVTNNELAFYQVVAKYNAPLAISTEPSSNTFLVTHNANRSFSGYSIDKVVTSSSSNNADRFFIYKKISD